MTCIIFHLGKYGFGAEIIDLIVTQCYCVNNNLELLTCSDQWSYNFSKGLEDYFESYFKKYRNLEGTVSLKIRGAIGEYGTSPMIISYDEQKIKEIEDNTIQGEVFRCSSMWEKISTIKYTREELRDQLLKFWKLNPVVTQYVKTKTEELNLPETYIAIHIRRGDKVKEEGQIEKRCKEYIEEISNTHQGVKDIFLMTDDQYVLNELNELTEYTFYYFKNNTTPGGHQQGEFNKLDKQIRYNHTLNLITEIEIARKALVFKTTYKSNLSILIDCLSIGNSSTREWPLEENSITLNGGILWISYQGEDKKKKLVIEVDNYEVYKHLQHEKKKKELEIKTRTLF